MSKTPIQQDGSTTDVEDADRSPFEQQEVDNEAGNNEDRPVDPRMSVMDAAAEAADRDRMSGEPLTADDMPFGEPPPEFDDPDGADSRAEMFPEGQEDPEEGLPEEFANDPLAEFIEMQDDKPMFRTVVNGQQKLIPLEKARATIQKHEAADLRLQEAHQIHQSLAQREAAIRAREAEVSTKLQNMHSQPSPRDADVDEEALRKEAREVVKDLFTGSEDEAAAQLADLLIKTRAPAAATPSIDPQIIANQAVAAARQQLSAEAQDRDVKKGYQKFVADYPEIAEDDVLFKVADGMTDEIQAEHPDWMPSEVMLEAGKRVREWVNAQKGDTEISDQPDSSQVRQERKRRLRPTPRARQGSLQQETADDKPDTPADVMAEIRAARGQPVA